MKILYPPFGYNFADDTKGVVKGAQGNGIDTSNQDAILHVCTQFVDDVNFVKAAEGMTHEERLIELTKIGFQTIEETGKAAK